MAGQAYLPPVAPGCPGVAFASPARARWPAVAALCTRCGGGAGPEVQRPAGAGAARPPPMLPEMSETFDWQGFLVAGNADPAPGW